jgi:hypothetical protein
MLRRVALVITDVSEELSSSFIRVTRIGELGTAPAVTSNRRTLRRNIVTLASYIRPFTNLMYNCLHHINWQLLIVTQLLRETEVSGC